MIFDSWDLAVKDKETSDFIAGVIFGVLGALRYILHVTKKKAGFTESIRAIKNHRERYPLIQRTVIEDKANGSPAIEVLKKEISGIIRYVPKASKLERLMVCLPAIEAGQLLLPANNIATFNVDDYIGSLTKFPNADYDDDVDATTCGLIYLISKNKSIHVD